MTDLTTRLTECSSEKEKAAGRCRLHGTIHLCQAIATWITEITPSNLAHINLHYSYTCIFICSQIQLILSSVFKGKVLTGRDLFFQNRRPRRHCSCPVSTCCFRNGESSRADHVLIRMELVHAVFALHLSNRAGGPDHCDRQRLCPLSAALVAGHRCSWMATSAAHFSLSWHEATDAMQLHGHTSCGGGADQWSGSEGAAAGWLWATARRPLHSYCDRI